MRMRFYREIRICLVLICALLTATVMFFAAPALCNNPIFAGADPDVLIAKGEYWVYPTGGNQLDSLHCYSSPNLRDWTERGTILKLDRIAWIKDDGASKHQLWAPGICQANGKYYLYFSVGPQNPTPSRIGVAVASAPDATFVDSGKPLLTGGHGFEAIDAMVFKDPESGKHLLYCGGSAGAKLRVFELNPDMITIAREIPVKTPVNFTEGSFMHYWQGKYYFSYSHGVWNSEDYSVCYSTADTPFGPWQYKGTILKKDNNHAGPGHHSIFCNPSTGRWYIVYHRWNGAIAAGKMPECRSVCIDRLEYDKSGNILPVKMTDDGVAPSLVKPTEKIGARRHDMITGIRE